jgi:Xaa-Pro aminopeptidase
MKLHPSHGNIFGSFAQEEYDSRFERARTLMAASDIDALLISQHQNLCYFSGITGYDLNWSRWFSFFPSLVIIPATKEPEAIVHSIYMTSAPFAQNFNKMEFWSEIDPSSEPEYIRILQSRLEALGLDKAKIGCELGMGYRMELPFNDFKLITDRLRYADFVDCTPLITEMRIIKSEGEISYIRKACEVQDAAIAGMRDRLHEGMPGTAAQQILREETTKAGGRPMWELGSHYSGRPSEGDRVLERGDIFTFDIGTLYGSYHADYGRTWVVGKPDTQQEKDHENAARAVNAAVDACSPGAIISDVVRKTYAEIEKSGAVFSKELTESGAIGHGVGLDMGEWPGMSPHMHDELRPGMVIALEPFILSNYGWFNMEQMIAITEDGTELLSRAPMDFFQIR